MPRPPRAGDLFGVLAHADLDDRRALLRHEVGEVGQGGRRRRGPRRRDGAALAALAAAIAACTPTRSATNRTGREGAGYRQRDEHCV